ncbi:putative transporter MCH1 [Escovopsis weberi]|uniref:Probable transporter MCH1 n=1 Tax=Escovopsis weberi TaxID=150374 RepID=A0A0M9VXE5_ESCWE|nr:putative transporter MCH1 [Escovopsis weberi]
MPKRNPPRDHADRASIASEGRGSSYSISDSTARRRQLRSKQAARLAALVFATVAALCAGSISAFSLYAPKLQSRLRYSQFQVNGVAIGSSVALYLPVSAMGLVCDRVGMAPMSFLSAFLFAGGYGLAATIYNRLDREYNHSPPPGIPSALGDGGGGGSGSSSSAWSYPLMVAAFVMIGAGTCAMYIASLSACAKNFGKGRFRGLALAMPIAGFGLSGMWLSQAGSRVFYEEGPDGSRDVDVFRFFLFLAALLFVIGIAGTFFLRVVDEEELIEDAIEEMESSGLLTRPGDSYGATHSSTQEDSNTAAAAAATPHHPDHAQAMLMKSTLLNAETRRFLTDRTMWAFALAFFLMIGPGEAFVNNVGTVIGTLVPRVTEGIQAAGSASGGNKTSVATQVSLFGIASTTSRLMIGTLTDILAPSPDTSTVQLSEPPRDASSSSSASSKRFTVSRVAFLLAFASLLAAGLLFLASGAAQNHSERFWLVSSLVGAGYGALFSLTPIIVTIIWGVENFATNYGIIVMLPAVGSTFWGLVYSAVYEAGAGEGQDGGDAFCHGTHCYAPAFWAEGLSVLAGCAILLWVWRGKAGWASRGIVI